MDLKIFNSILYGQLRPWLDKNRIDRFYTNRMTPNFIKPSHSINDYFTELKSILGKDNELTKDDNLDIYLRQPKKDINVEISQPLISFLNETLKPTSPTERFYFNLIRNEATRTINNIFIALCREIKEIDRKYIVNSYKNSFVELLKNIASISDSITEEDKLSQRVINVLQENAIRILLELQHLFSDLLNTIEADKHQIFQEYLNQNPPDGEYFKVSNDIRQLKLHITEAKTGLKLKPVSNPNAVSFGFTGDTVILKSVLNRLELSVDLLKNETTSDYLYEVLTADDINLDGSKIFLGLNTNEFRYILDQIKPKFKNLKLSVIEKTNLFRSKDNPNNNLKARTLSSSKPASNTANKATIDNILKEL